jgi:predicted RecA/RadA family phage recombinase
MAVRTCKAGDMIDYKPAAAVTAGDVVVQNGLIGVANEDIAANKMGQLQVTGVIDCPAESGHAAIEVGADVYWDEDGTPQSGTAESGCATVTDTGYYLGKAVPPENYAASAAASAASANRVRVLKILIADNAPSS